MMIIMNWFRSEWPNISKEDKFKDLTNWVPIDSVEWDHYHSLHSVIYVNLSFYFMN